MIKPNPLQEKKKTAGTAQATKLIRARPVAGLFILTIGVMFLLASISETATARKRSAWQPVNEAQSNCLVVSNSSSDLITYYGVWIKGTWTHSINAGMDGAPAGTTISGSYLPIRPGSSDGSGSLAYVVVQVAPRTSIGTYPMSLWTDDGTTRQTVPVTLVVADSCGGY